MSLSLEEYYESNKLINDYLKGDCKSFHDLEFSKKSILEKSNSKKFDAEKRKILVDSLQKQYESLETSQATKENIEALANENTFTITTGHQLNIFTGPIFFFYKILQVINITEKLNAENSGKKFVPVFWMASEDHDFDEIASVNVFHEKISWEAQSGDAVGRMKIDGLKDVLEVIKSKFRENESDIFKVLDNYISNNNLGEAALYLTNYLFGKYGLVILDADNKDLKKLFIPVMKEELTIHKSHIAIHDTLSEFDKKNYKIQVNPREINLFYLKDGYRGRIIKEGNIFTVTNTTLTFDEGSFLAELDAFPERFSPNVVLRPMFQETILPNLAYLGGAGEIAYWLEFKKAFQVNAIEFPILIVRNSMLLIDKNTNKKLSKTGIKATEFLKNEDAIIDAFIRENSDEVDLNTDVEALNQLKQNILEKSTVIDASMSQAIEASFSKFEKELNKIEGKLVKALKQNSENEVNAIRAVKNKFYPEGIFQERYENGIPYLVTFGLEFIDFLKENIGDFDQKLEFVDLEEYGKNN